MTGRFEKFTPQAREAIRLAEEASRTLSHGSVGTEHLLLGLLEEGTGVASRVLSECGVEKEKVIELMQELISGSNALKTRSEMWTPRAERVLENSYHEAVRFKAPLVGTEHILIAIIRENDCVATRILNTMGVSVQKIYVDLFSAMGEDAPAGREDAQTGRGKKGTPVLDSYSRDLTALAREGKLDPVIGRNREISRVIQILSRRTKNNPCLIGEPGVGKTAVVEGLAQMIVSGNVPETIAGKRVVTLDLSGMVAGSKYRGEFEERIKKVLAELRDDGDVLLFIDEIHTIIGAGGAEGALDASNILKPSLARGELQLIGATTIEEYRKYIEKDSALERRFQPVTVDEPDEEASIAILKGLKGKYEEHHKVTITDEAIEAAVKLSARYINDRFLPDKAIDLIDEACSRLNLDSPQLSEIPELQNELERLQAQLDELTQSSARAEEEETYAKIATCRSRILQVEAQLHELLTKPAPQVDEQLLAEVIEIWTGIPASKVAAQESARLRDMESRLKSHVIGQDEAVDAVCASIRRNRAGISPKRKPASFLFVGPTGVGKTELVKQLALDLFDSPDALVRLDMSEYMEKHTVSRLIGSPPGYVGYDEAGQLTEKIRRRPYSVVLFDEIEKAHPDVLNSLLQILDDGRLTDAQGRVVSFENTVIVMTSNAGSQSNNTPAGFGRTVSQMSKDRVMKALEEIMRPEFLNRIDEIIAFNQLSEDNFRHIAEIMLGELRTTLADKDIRLTWDDSLLGLLTEKSYSVKYGARNLRRLIEKEIENPLATAIVTGDKPLMGAHLSAEDGKVKLDTI